MCGKVTMGEENAIFVVAADTGGIMRYGEIDDSRRIRTFRDHITKEDQMIGFWPVGSGCEDGVHYRKGEHDSEHRPRSRKK